MGDPEGSSILLVIFVKTLAKKSLFPKRKSLLFRGEKVYFFARRKSYYFFAGPVVFGASFAGAFGAWGAAFPFFALSILVLLYKISGSFEPVVYK